MKGTHNYKGFFFVLVSFILLSYILVSTYAWVRAIEASERTYSDAFRASTLNTLTEQVSEQRMNIYTDVAAHYTMYKLANHSVKYPLLDEEVDEYHHIRAAYSELLIGCNTSKEHFQNNVPVAYEGDEDTYCFAGFLRQLNASLAKSGFGIDEFSVYNISLNETAHPLEFELNLTLYLKIKDTQTETALERTYHISRIVNVTGFKDPLLERQSIAVLDGKINHSITKGMYLYTAEEANQFRGIDADDILLEDMHTLFYPEVIAEGNSNYETGQGWFYGPIILATDSAALADLEDEKRIHYILAGNFSDITGVQGYQHFGAYIVTSEPEESKNDCGTSQSATFNPVKQDDKPEGGGSCPDEYIDNPNPKPFIVYADEEDFMDDIYGESIGPSDAPHSVLFISTYSHEQIVNRPERKKDSEYKVYNIEVLRDFARCSYYVVHANESPSYFQRLLVNGYQRTSPLGIETLLIGKWAGGISDPGRNELSRVDWEFFAEHPVEGIKIRGMPGCKDVYMCADADSGVRMVSDVGNFRLSDPMDMEFYLGTSEKEENAYIGCDDDRASCETP